MDVDEFPPNSDKSKLGEYEDKKVERVTTSEPIRKKKGLGKQFKNTFFGGDAKGALQFVIFGVLVPAAKDALADAGAQGIERLIFGDSRYKRSAPPSGPAGHIAYNRFSASGARAEAPTRTLSRRARARHDFDEIVLTSRTEAEEVIDRLFDLVSRYEAASVADLYDLVGLASTHADYKWGWTDIRGAGVARVRSGFLLDLPEPEPLHN